MEGLTASLLQSRNEIGNSWMTRSALSSLPLSVPTPQASDSTSSIFSTLSCSHPTAVYNFWEFTQDGYFEPRSADKQTTECVLQYDDPYNKPNSAKRPLVIPVDATFPPSNPIFSYAPKKQKKSKCTHVRNMHCCPRASCILGIWISR